jgi:Flp pilus assembly pilin Flp
MFGALRGLKLYLMARGHSEKGVTTVEYAIMLVLVAWAVATFGPSLSNSVTGVFDDMVTELDAAG